MPPWFIHGAAIAGRVLIGLFGCLCFYVAFCMYEDEQGKWQNRLDELWTEIYDRAKVTNSKTTALFNKVGEEITKFSTYVFGARLFSFRSVIASVDLSVACSSLVMLVAHFTDYVWRTPPLGAMPDPVKQPSHTAISFFVYLLGGIFPAIVRKRWAPLVPLGVFLYFAFSLSHVPFFYARLGLYPRYQFIAALAFSFLCDVVVIALLRKALAQSASEISMLRIGLLALFIMSAALVVEFSPAFVLAVVARVAPSIASITFSAALVAMMLNTSSIAYCLVDFAFLLFVVAHRIFWPALSRVIYPFCRFTIVTNKVALVSIGALCLTFAFHLEKVGLKEILKLAS